MIIPMEKKHVGQVAELHYKYTRSLLRDLGRRMCIVFYENALKCDNFFGYVYLENMKVIGFICGMKDNSQLFRSARIRLELCLCLLSKPHLIKRVISRLRNKVPPTPEGGYSAVDVEFRRKGIGMKLYQALNEGFRERGITYFEHRIDADNITGLNLRRRLGAKIKEELFENGVRRYRLYTKLDP